MNTATNTSLIKNLQRIVEGLTNITSHLASLSQTTPTKKVDGRTTRWLGHQSKAAKPKRRAVKARGKAPQSRLPKHLDKVVKKLSKSKREFLSDEQKQDIKQLLLHSSISVADIAALYHRKPQTIYNLRDQLAPHARKGSPALIAGVKRAQKEGKMQGPGKRETSVVVPQVEAAQA